MTSRQILLAFVPPLGWGTGFTLAKPAVSHFPPLLMMMLIYVGIALVLLATERERIKTPWPTVLWISALAVTIQGGLIFLGLRGLTATTANLVLQIQVPMAVMLGWLLGGETLEPRKLLGTLIALLGVGLVIGLPEETPPAVPIVLMIAGGFIWAVGQVMIQKHGRDTGLLLLKANALAAVPQLLLATALFETGQLEAVEMAGPAEWGALAFVGVIGFYVAYAVWYTLLRQCRMDEVAPFILLMPMTGILTASLVLGEAISAAQILGGLVILCGLAIVSLRLAIPKRT